MFSKLFGKRGPQLVPMLMDHLEEVVQVIDQTDEDDAREAAQSMIDRGTDGMYVLMEGRRVIGVTGFWMEEGADRTAWLSWTYLDDEHRGDGLGRFMLDELLTMLRAQDVRKLFIATSDYKEDGAVIYEDAHRMYEAFGAKVEVAVPDYHARGETKIIYGLTNPEATTTETTPARASTGIQIVRARPAPESQGALALEWEESTEAFTGLERAMSSALPSHLAVLALPSDLSSPAGDALIAAGFQRHGQCADFYERGLHQVWWSLRL